MKIFATWFLEHWVVLFIGWVMCFFAMLMIVKMAVEVPENHPDFNKDFNQDFYIASKKKNEDFKAIFVWPYIFFKFLKNLFK